MNPIPSVNSYPDFAVFVNRSGFCWTCTVPQLSFGGKVYRSADLAWLLSNGDTEQPTRICRNPDCVRPNHLQPPSVVIETKTVTKITKKKFTRSKVSLKQVRQIRKLHAEGCRAARLAEWFGLTRAAIHYIVTRRSYPDVV